MSLTDRIDSLRRRLERVRWRTALGWVVATIIGVATLLMLCDYVVRSHDRGLRWIASLALEAAVLVAMIRWVWPLLREPLTCGGVAQQLQRHFPQLGSRLASALEFSAQSEHDPAAGSADLRRAVVVETSTEVSDLSLEEVIDRAPLRRASWALALATLATLAFALADPSGWATAATRLATPWTDVDWPRKHNLQLVDAPQRIARGSEFEVAIVDDNAALPNDLQVYYRNQGDSDGRIDLAPAQYAGDKAIVRREAVQQSFEFRITGGDDLGMPWQQVEVVDPPQVTDVVIHAQPPTYTGLTPRTVGPEIAILSGTRLALSAETSEPIESAHVAIRKVGTDADETLAVTDVDSANKTLSLAAAEWGKPLASGEPLQATYKIEAENQEGFIGSTSPSPLRIETDPPPQVSWQTPSADLFLIADAVVPVAATATDNLQVHWIDLVATPVSAEPTSEVETKKSSTNPSETNEMRLRLFVGSENPSEQPDDTPLVGLENHDRQRGAETWDLASLKFEPGDQWLLTIEASDYRPGIGRTPQSRRLVIITPAELDARIAQQAAGLVRDLERAAAQQRSARDGTRELAIEQQTGQPVDRSTTDRLATLGYEQRETKTILGDPSRGVAAQAKALAEEIENNRLERPELTKQLSTIRDALENLEADALPDAERALTDARRSAERLLESRAADARAQLGEALNAAGASQENSVATLETLIDGLGKWSDLQRFSRQVQQLQQRQQQLAGQARKEAAASAANPNSPQRMAAREKLAGNQAELTRQFGRLQQAMRQELNNANQGSTEQQQAVEDALAESDERATAGKMQRSSQQLQQGQLGRAAENQQAAADDLQQILDTLRDRAASDPAKLAEQLRKQARRLEELRDQLKQTKDVFSHPSDEQLDQLAKKAERLSRKLDRLTADQAASSVASGAQQLASGSEQTGQPASPQPKQKMEQADQKLADAKRQLQQKIEELENEITEKLLKQLAEKVKGYIERQQQVLEETVKADDVPQPDRESARQLAEQLADEQSTLQAEVAASAEELARRAVFELALSKTAAKMADAAERLGAKDVGRQTQQTELAALTRLKHIADALKPPPPPEQPPQQPQEGGGGQGGQPPKPPLIALAELKMLRLMQLGINAETRELEADAAAQLLAPAEAAQAASRIAGEQQKLSALARELAARNNEAR